MRPRRGLLLSSLLLLSIVHVKAAAAEPTAADLETARALYKEGKALRAAGHVQEALEKLRAAHTLGQTPVTGIELARTYVMLGELVEARDVALGVARIPVASDETERSAEARTDAAALAEDLRARIPSIEIHADGATEIAVDGERLPGDALGEPRKVNPGAHAIVARTADGREARASVTVGERETRVVTVSFSAAPPPPPSQTNVAALQPEDFIFGAGFTLSPHVYFPATAEPSYKTVLEVMAGASVEAGAALTPRFEILGRAFGALGDRGKPSWAIAAGPAFSYRVIERVWLGAGVAAGRADTKFEGLPYSTDWVLAGELEASYALLETPHGEWLVSLVPGYFFANQHNDNPDVFVNVSFGFRSF